MAVSLYEIPLRRIDGSPSRLADYRGKVLLVVNVASVKNHISDILRKLDARDRTHAVLKAIAGHFLSNEDSVTD
jgi:glutathione peroxidase-family protein